MARAKGRAEAKEKPKTRKMNIAIDEALMPWVEFAAALSGTNVTAYINEAIARDCDNADAETAKAYAAFIAARNGRRAVFEKQGKQEGEG